MNKAPRAQHSKPRDIRQFVNDLSSSFPGYPHQQESETWKDEEQSDTRIKHQPVPDEILIPGNSDELLTHRSGFARAS